MVQGYKYTLTSNNQNKSNLSQLKKKITKPISTYSDILFFFIAQCWIQTRYI